MLNNIGHMITPFVFSGLTSFYWVYIYSIIGYNQLFAEPTNRPVVFITKMWDWVESQIVLTTSILQQSTGLNLGRSSSLTKWVSTLRPQRDLQGSVGLGFYNSNARLGRISNSSHSLNIVAEHRFDSRLEFKFNQVGNEIKASKGSTGLGKLRILDFAHGFAVKITTSVTMFLFYSASAGKI